jgi:hypothetical protein
LGARQIIGNFVPRIRFYSYECVQRRCKKTKNNLQTNINITYSKATYLGFIEVFMPFFSPWVLDFKKASK